MTQNLYLLLGVAPTASSTEIEAAIDAKMNETRRLVTNHNRDVALKAQQDLLAIEDARKILLDPTQRASYDAVMGFSSGEGGLRDPDAPDMAGHSGASSFAGYSTARPNHTDSRPVDAWVCSTCGTASAVGTRNCRNCGNQLGLNCPRCQQLIQQSDKYCPSCGVEVATAVQEMQIRQDEAERDRQVQAKNAKREEERLIALRSVQEKVDSAWRWIKWGWAISVLSLGFLSIVSVGFWIVAFVKANSVLRTPQGFYDDSDIRGNAKRARNWALIPLVILLGMLVCGFVAQISLLGISLSEPTLPSLMN